jgi:hypothetical protein
MEQHVGISEYGPLNRRALMGAVTARNGAEGYAGRAGAIDEFRDFFGKQRIDRKWDSWVVSVRNLSF